MDALPPPDIAAFVQAARTLPVQKSPPVIRSARGDRGTIAKREGGPSGDSATFGPDNVYANIPRRDDRGRDQLAIFRAWNPDPIANHARNLAAIQPQLAAVVRKAQADNPGLRFVIGSGFRSQAEQRQAGNWGWSPWPGRRSKNAASRKHLDGEAVDLWPLDASNRVIFDPVLQAKVALAMKAAARDLGVALLWGGNWRSRRKDLPHFELRG